MLKLVLLATFVAVAAAMDIPKCDYAPLCTSVVNPEVRAALVKHHGNDAEQNKDLNCMNFPNCGAGCGSIKAIMNTFANAKALNKKGKVTKTTKEINTWMKKKCKFTSPIIIPKCADGHVPTPENPCTEPIAVTLTHQIHFHPNEFACNQEEDHVVKGLKPEWKQIIKDVAGELKAGQLKGASCVIRGYYYIPANAPKPLQGDHKTNAKCRATFIVNKLKAAGVTTSLTGEGYQYSADSPKVDLNCQFTKNKVVAPGQQTRFAHLRASHE